MSAAIAENTAAPFDKEQLLACLRALSAEEMAAIWTEIQRGAPAVKPPAAPASKERKPKAAAAAAAAAPEAEDGEAPSAASYRVSSVKEGVCVARRISEGTKDARWKPAIYAEEQCGRAVEAGSDLCPICKNHLQKYTDNPSPKAGWHGRVSEEPLDWMHMLGTAWAAKANPRFGAGSAAVSEAASVASAPAAKPGRKPKQTEEEKAAAKEAKAAAAAEAKAAKAAEKAAIKAAADAAAKKVREEAAAKKAAAGGGGGTPAPAAKADTATPAATVAHKIVCVAGEMYAVRGRNAFEYNPMDDSVGEYKGRLSEDGNSVDAEAPEEE